MKRQRIVLDTNVLISAVLFGGPPRDVLELVISGAIDCSLSLPILDETREVLRRTKFGFSPEQSFQLLEELHAACDVINPTTHVQAVASDPDDNMILECALASNADVVVSGDHHLLDLIVFRGIYIVAPSDYLKKIENKTNLPKRSSVRRVPRHR
ncbi:MAG: putative toxin-antitoxin system toxin component, PIN family [Verrucomicrobia bacterium]|nr:putative toxin-antitoxin system toxin component, PIN family [Verrucomicrobiota bacterium]MBU1736043.1 putative toxin-antitoxin system toxin component, PIN family [Verrucomicrobiota bacterium]MBU1855827.1 putative toxin-antitoxin system toxin component, PIN family [Verrucomicrobiota bacterium]